MEGEPHNNVIPLRRPGTEYINGIALPLASLSLSRLLEVEADCQAHLEEAKTDLSIVQDYLGRRFPDGGGNAA